MAYFDGNETYLWTPYPSNGGVLDNLLGTEDWKITYKIMLTDYEDNVVKSIYQPFTWLGRWGEDKKTTLMVNTATYTDRCNLLQLL